MTPIDVVAKVIEKGLKDKPIEIHNDERPWVEGQCFACGRTIMVKDDFTPYDCPLCNHSRGGD